MNPMWKVYKSKVMKTLNPDMEEEETEEVNNVAEEIIPVQTDEGGSAVTQLAKRMQGAGARGWKSVSSLFGKDDEHHLLEAENQPAADHPLAVKPEEPPRPNKRNSSAFWDHFATRWHQTSAVNEGNETGCDVVQEAGTESVGERVDEGPSPAAQEEDADGAGNSFPKYATLGGSDGAPPFKWSFVTSKIAELRSRSLAKSN